MYAIECSLIWNCNREMPPVPCYTARMIFELLGAIYAIMSLITFVAYAVDKSRAIHQRRRIPERTLHVLELLGGWPGALIAQPVFRHKLQKTSYMLAFAAIVLLHAISWGAWFHWGR